MILSPDPPSEQPHRTSSTTPTNVLSTRKSAMNLSDGESLSNRRLSTGDNESKETGVIDRNANSSARTRTPTQFVKRLLSPKSWHGDKPARTSRSKSRSRRGEDRTASATPESSPRTSRKVRRASRSGSRSLRGSRTSETDESIQKILEPNYPSPGTPGTTPRQKATVKAPPKNFPLLVPPAQDNDNSTRERERSTNAPKRISAGSANVGEKVIIPVIYKHARKCNWDDFEEAIPTSSQDMDFIYNKDGTTVLHMAVMSRTGYINAFKSAEKEFDKAPMKLIEEILYNFPELSQVKCSLNGYTPLTYACLVCSSNYDVEDAAEMVRLFLKYTPEAVKLFTKDGLSPVDIHVVSYSHHHRRKEDFSSQGRTSATVLRTLLTHSPELAINRIFQGKVKGPIELLYKCNAKAFSKAVMDEIYEGDDRTVQSDFTLPERRQRVVDTVKKWWIWTWTVMILKYGSLKQKKRGAQFSAVHSAAMQIGCPTPMLSITLYAFPRQIKQSILDRAGHENLPLHAVCSWLSNKESGPWPSLIETRKSQAIARIVEEYPSAAKVTNVRGESPLELATKSGTLWEGGVRRLVKAYPKSLKVQSKVTGLYPFMTAAAAANVEPSSNSDREASVIQTIYGLLRSNPRVLVQSYNMDS